MDTPKVGVLWRNTKTPIWEVRIGDTVAWEGSSATDLSVWARAHGVTVVSGWGESSTGV